MRLRHLLKTTALTALLLIAGKVGWTQVTSAQSGAWNSTSTWVGGVVPTATDNVLIADGHTVTITSTPITVASLTVGQGTSGVLTFDATTGRALTVTGDVTVASGGKFIVYPIYTPTGDVTSGSAIIANVSSTAGLANGMTITGTGIPAATTISAFDATTITLSANATATGTAVPLTINSVTITNTIAIGGNLTNNGVFDMSMGTSTSVCNATFNKVATSDQIISGTGVTTRFRGITLNRANIADKVTSSINVIMNGSALFIFTKGTWEQTAGILTVVGGNQSVSANGSLIFSGSGGLLQTGSSWDISGNLTVNTSGTVTIGAGNNRLATTAGTATLNFLAGTVNINGRLSLVTASSTTIINGANIIIDPQVGTTYLGNTSNCFELSSTANLTFSSGTVTFVDPLNATGSGSSLKISSTGTVDLTGSTFIFGDGVSSTTGADGFKLSSTLPLKNVTIQTGGAALRNVNLTANATVNGKLTMKSGALALSTYSLTYGASAILEYAGAASQTTGVERLATLPNLTINNSNGVVLSGNTTISNALTFTSGKLDLGAYNLTIGSSGSIVGADASKYLITSGAGLLKMNTVAVGTATYPIGSSASSYTPFLSTNNTSSDILGVNIHNTFTHATLDNEKCVKLEWQGTDGTPGGNDGTITFSWNASDQGSSFDPSQTVLLGVWDGSKYATSTVPVTGSGPYTVTMPVPVTYPTTPVIFGNTGAFPIDAPVLTAATANNDVDHNFDITYTADAAYQAAITDVKVNGTSLNAADWDKTAAGIITLKPTVGNALLTVAGTKTITVIATGYFNSSVSQVINVGVPVATNSTISNAPAMGVGTTSTVTLTAKDQYNNLVAGYAFKYDATVTNTDATNAESYTIATNATTTSVTDVVLPVTNASGVATFDIVVPGTVDPLDGVSVQVQMNDGTTNLGSPIFYTAPAGPSISIAATLGEKTLNTATIALTVQNETFANAAPVSINNFTLNHAPTGLTINNVVFNSTTSATITLAFDGTDFDVDVTNFSVTVAGVELTATNPLTSNNITITAVNETPVVTTNAAFTTNGVLTATWGGNVSADGGQAVTEKGICWSTTVNPTISDSKTTEGAGIGTITGNMTSLLPSTLYHVRAYASNSDLTAYGDDKTFTTNDPTLTLNALGASSYYSGDVIALTWTSVGVTNVKIELYDGTSYSTLIASTASDGSESVTIPTSTSTGTTYKIKISDVDNTSIFSESAAFTINQKASIYDIQYTTSTPANSPFSGKVVTTQGIVTGIQGTQTAIFIQDGTGPWSGLYVYCGASSGLTTVALGDLVSVTGTIIEYSTLTEMSPTTALTIISSGNALPTPVALTTLAAASEQYESVLVKVSNATCSTGLVLNDGTGPITAFNKLYSGLSLTIGSVYTVTGFMAPYTTLWEIYPRNAADILNATATVTSTAYTVNNTDGTITNIPFSATYSQFEANIAFPSGSTHKFYLSDGVTETTTMATGNILSVTAQDGLTTKNYTITLNSISSAKDITAFSIGAYTGTITGTNISVVVSSTYDLSNLIATFTLSPGATAKVGNVAQVSGTTVNNFTNPVTYVVTAEDLSTQNWTVTITKQAAGAVDLFFSEYGVGTSNNKEFEIYNPTSAAVDLSGYTVKLSNNGAGFGKWAGPSGVPPYTGGGDDIRYVLTFPSGTMIAAGDVYVVYNSGATVASGIPAVGDLALTYSSTTNLPTDNGANVASFNGNDALGLFKGTTLIDVFGDEHVAATGSSTPVFNVAGQIGAAQYYTLVRKPNVHSGNTDWVASAGTDAASSEWIVYPKDDFSHLGSHTMNPITSGPSITASTATLTDFGNVIKGNVSSSERSFTVLGTDLTANIVITAPAGFQISTGSGAEFVASVGPITLTKVNGAVAEKAIYVKFAPTAAQVYSGNITVTSTGAANKNIAVSGTGLLTGIDKNWDSNVTVYPNPFTDAIRFTGTENVNRVIITNVTGQVVRNIVIGKDVNSVNTQNLHQGIYLVTFMNDKGEKSVHKMVKL